MKGYYIKTKLQTVVNIPKIITIHYYEFDKSFVFEGESHDFWEMVYIDKGRVRVKTGKDAVVLEQGDIIFHAPNEFHAIEALDSAPNFFVISFVCHSPAIQCFKKFHSTLDKRLKTFIASIIREAEETYIIPKNDTALNRLTKKDAAPLGGEQLIKMYLEQFLIILMREITQKQTSLFPSKESMQTQFVLSLKEYIDLNIEKSIKTHHLCEKFGYSMTHLCKLFKEQCGETITAYITRTKIERAKLLIREDTLSFAEVSARLDFDTPQYFSRVFKRVTDMSPTEFKNSLRRT